MRAKFPVNDGEALRSDGMERRGRNRTSQINLNPNIKVSIQERKCIAVATSPSTSIKRSERDMAGGDVERKRPNK